MNICRHTCFLVTTIRIDWLVGNLAMIRSVSLKSPSFGSKKTLAFTMPYHTSFDFCLTIEHDVYNLKHSMFWPPCFKIHLPSQTNKNCGTQNPCLKKTSAGKTLKGIEMEHIDKTMVWGKWRFMNSVFFSGATGLDGGFFGMKTINVSFGWKPLRGEQHTDFCFSPR